VDRLVLGGSVLLVPAKRWHQTSSKMLNCSCTHILPETVSTPVAFHLYSTFPVINKLPQQKLVMCQLDETMTCTRARCQDNDNNTSSRMPDASCTHSKLDFGWTICWWLMTTMTGRTAQAALLTTLAAHNRPVAHAAGPTAFSQPSSELYYANCQAKLHETGQ